MGTKNVAEKSREREPAESGPAERLSGPEFDFLQRWRALVDEIGGDGGQVRVAGRLNWSTSTVSRDHAGATLPSDERLKELSDYLRLAQDQRVELAVLLQRARDARQERKNAGCSQPHEAAVSDGKPRRPVRPGGAGRRWIARAVAAATAGVVAWRHWPDASARGSTGVVPPAPPR